MSGELEIIEGRAARRVPLTALQRRILTVAWRICRIDLTNGAAESAPLQEWMSTAADNLEAWAAIIENCQRGGSVQRA